VALVAGVELALLLVLALVGKEIAVELLLQQVQVMALVAVVVQARLA
jgi:hypothetical protein